MNDERGPVRRAPTLEELFERVAAGDVRRLAAACPPETPQCPSIVRHRRAALRHDWSPDELAHVEQCERCRRTRENVSTAVWHPEVRMFVARLAERIEQSDAQALDAHLHDDGCRSCARLLSSPWLRELAAGLRRRHTDEPPAVPDRYATAWGELPRAVGEFATGTRPPFQLRAEAASGSLVVTLRETDQGQFVVHVEAPDCDREGQMVRVELLGEGDPLVADVELTKVDGERGCIGRHAFGSFAELVPPLRPAVALLAVLADARPS